MQIAVSRYHRWIANTAWVHNTMLISL